MASITGRGCSVNECEREVSGRGYCNPHYQRWYRGQPLGGPEVRQYATAAEALAARVVRDAAGCLVWQGTRDAGGYGRVGTGGVVRLAHRVAWELANGRPVPDGLQIDHLCRNRACVNPAHLEPVTPTENVRRSTVSERNHNRSKTRCVAGHEFTPENTYVWTDGHRSCRACHRARELARYNRRKEAAA